MGHPLRMFGENDVWFITVRNFQQRKLMTPRTALVRDVCGGVLAEALRMYGFQVHGYVFLSNHFHLIVRGRGIALARFMQFLLSNLARKLMPLCARPWWGRFWERRYTATPILDDAALEGLLGYVLSHGVKEGLVRGPMEWEGLHCASQFVEGRSETHPWFDWTKRWLARNAKGPLDRYCAEIAEPVELKLTPIPSWAAMTRSQRVARLTDITAHARAKAPGRVVGVRAIRAQGLEPPAERLARKRPQLSHGQVPQQREEHREAYRNFVRMFRQASVAWRSGCADAGFPPECFKPTIWAGAVVPPS